MFGGARIHAEEKNFRPALAKFNAMDAEDGRRTMCVRLSFLASWRETDRGLLLVYADGTREELEMSREEAAEACRRITNAAMLHVRARASLDILAIHWTPGGGSNLSPAK